MKFQARYSISDLEKLSGIKAHTLRIWEKRYSLLRPERTGTNIRFYTNDDLRRILNVGLLNKHGIKISAIARMGSREMTEKISAIQLVRTGNDDLIDSLVVSMIEMDERKFGGVVAACILRTGFERCVQEVLFPLFERIGIMWQTGGINPAQEHFVSNIVRQKLIAAVDGLPPPGREGKAPAALLFCPENELHELSLLFYHYALRSRKIRTVYLGQTVPLQSLARIVEITRAKYLVCTLTNPIEDSDLEEYLLALSRLEGPKKILASGRALVHYKGVLPPGVFRFGGLPDLVRLLR
jgi:DNA-binding transcriptional MerR regulator